MYNSIDLNMINILHILMKNIFKMQDPNFIHLPLWILKWLKKLFILQENKQ